MAVPRFKMKVAAVHAAPVYMDKEATTAKVVSIIKDAGEQGIKLLAFPETFIPGYPVCTTPDTFSNMRMGWPQQYFILAYPPLDQIPALAQYARQSVVCSPPDACVRAVQDACRAAGVTVSLGVSERVAGGHTLFNSQVTIEAATGDVLGVHRKLQPTLAERYVWAQGDGSTLRVWRVGVDDDDDNNDYDDYDDNSVDNGVESGGVGVRVGEDGEQPQRNERRRASGDDDSGKKSYNLGGLCCWENTLNGARQALIEADQHVHVGAWPALSTVRGFDRGVADAQIEALTRAHALTAQAFVLCAADHVDGACLEWMRGNLGEQGVVGEGGGWSAVVHPFCSYLAGPHTGGEDRLVAAEVDFGDLGPVKVWIDGNGHYKRPEVLEMRVERKSLWTVPGSDPVSQGRPPGHVEE
ncbi:hypothetical protein VPNG_05906 [Cytospora leucostoma]|uniref:CN hydrolase domain-containing protein n=1 Tax=Cytospora leucostoma TaxID=1230097 RepID=A0A423XAQ9_9PEZI|nr:hypothetical protein VPNG_05906 [Cytospora leucostoma]